MKNAIETLIKTYETALNGNDIDTIMALYGKAPVFMPQHSTALTGRNAVRAGYEHVFSSIKLAIVFQIHDLEIAGEFAWARTSSSGKVKILAANVTVTESNNELFILHKENGQWKIHQYLFATSEPRT